MAEVKQPEWFPPDESNGFYAGLQVFNSLTSSKVKFVPMKGKRVGWYICGPTTYDSSHLGHARNYVTFDIIRRLLEDYFGYEVFSVMNITDVDDKIILKARRNFLYEKYEQAHPHVTAQVAEDLRKGWDSYCQSLQKKYLEVDADPVKKKSEKDAEKQLLKEKLDEAQKSREEVNAFLAQNANSNNVSVTKILDLSREPLAILVDNREGSTVRDQKIFRELAAKYEAEFMEDMEKLNVKMPDVLTRVTEYIPEIIDYVKKIMENGYGYVSNGSVYFDTIAFSKAHPYAKLEPKSIGNLKLIQEGEGSLTVLVTGGSEKKHGNDFALWKKSKEGEPQWDSPWGLGRPGWHIECSAMASSLLDAPLDVHSGGEDLRFPHHDNELAQSEAYYNSKQWVNYFLHSGHLHINGLKMSKSLKNFITIRKALEMYSPRQLRLLFLSQPWGRVINYSDETLLSVESKEKTIHEFFLVVRAVLGDQEHFENINQKWNEKDVALHGALLNVQEQVDATLKDNFDTPGALTALLEVIREANKYLVGNSSPKGLLLRKIALYVTKILRIFGVQFEKDFAATGASSSGEMDTEKVVRPYAKAIAQFRTVVRNAAISKQPPATFLQLCDDLRNETMPPLGVRLEDEGAVNFKFENPEELMKDFAAKKAAASATAKKKLLSKIKAIDDDLADFEKGKETPEEMFKKQGYKDFDAEGLPNVDPEGKEVVKSTKKKLQKLQATQQKLHKKHLDLLASDANYVQTKLKEKEELQKQHDTL